MFDGEGQPIQCAGFVGGYSHRDENLDKSYLQFDMKNPRGVISTLDDNDLARNVVSFLVSRVDSRRVA